MRIKKIELMANDRIKQELQYQLSAIEFMHVSSLLLVSNDKAIIDNVSHNPNKVIYNFSKVLTLPFHLRRLSFQNFYFRLNYYSVR